MLHEKSLRFRDFSGKQFTLPSNAEHYMDLGGEEDSLLLLGAGPCVCEMPFVRSFLEQKKNIYLFQSPIFEDILKKLPSTACFDLPPTIRRIDLDQAKCLAKKSRTYFYNPLMRIEPDFWGPLLGKVEANLTRKSVSKEKTAFLPGDKNQLLHLEMHRTLTEAGFTVISEDYSFTQEKFFSLPAMPEIVISINFRGLDAQGRIFNFCRALDIPVVIWLVDNPWHLLSALRLPWWKKAVILVTDPSFLPELKACGAENAHFLPLAASPHMLDSRVCGPNEPVFVGRSEFPEKKRYFAAARYNPQIMAQAMQLFNQGKLPDIHWWQNKTGGKLWPGFESRNPGLGAEDCSRYNRQRWLMAGIESGMQIYGDSGWKKLLPEASLHPPVDYYGRLPDIYASSIAVLNVTSLLLPQSLSQRHFDVWAAKGFLLTDPTKGLEIFPEDLVKPVTLENPEQLKEKLDFLSGNPSFRKEISCAWQNHIYNHHLYRHRLEKILEITGK